VEAVIVNHFRFRGLHGYRDQPLRGTFRLSCRSLVLVVLDEIRLSTASLLRTAALQFAGHAMQRRDLLSLFLGPAAKPGGAHDYLVIGRMIGGFAVVACRYNTARPA
jgi:hypothetical protein